MTVVSEGYEYWRKREERNLKRLKKEEKDWDSQIDQIYQRMISELDDEIALFYSRFANNAEMSMAEARKYLSKTDIDWYATRAKFYCELAAKDFAEGTDKRASIYFSDEANEEMLRYNATMRISRLEMLKSQMKLRILKAQSKAEETIDMALWQRTYDTFQHQAGILGNTVLDDVQPMVETIARSSFHGQEFSERIWGKQQTILQKQLDKALSECLILGKGASPFTRKLRKICNVSKYQAQRLMNTELARVQCQAEQEAYERCGFTDMVYLVNPSCCPECRKHDGRHFPTRKMEQGVNAPPLHPNCRCFTAPWLKREDDGITDQDIEDFDEWSETYDQHGLSWEYWKKQKRPKRPAKKAAKPQPKAEDFKLDDFDGILTEKKELANTKKFVQALNQLPETADNTVKKIYKLLGNGIKSLNLPTTIKHTKNSAIGIWSRRDTGEPTKLEYDFPKMKNPEHKAAFQTTVHETAHLIDFIVRKDPKSSKGAAPQNKKLMDALAQARREPGPSQEIRERMQIWKDKRQEIQDEESKVRLEKRKELSEKLNANEISFAEWKKLDRKAVKDADDSIERRWREIEDGNTALQDIYSALSGGRTNYNGLLTLGHSERYFRDPKLQIDEIIAEYAVLALTNKELLDMFRRDKPELADELERHYANTLKEMEKK